MLHIVYIKEIGKRSIHKHLLAFHHKKIVELCIYFSFNIFAVLQSGHRLYFASCVPVGRNFVPHA